MTTATKEPRVEEPTAETRLSEQNKEGDQEYQVASDGGTINARMLAILAEMPAIGKTQQNTQQNFMFRGHDDVLNALNPLLAKHGVYVVPDVISREVAQRATSRGSVMYEVNLHVRFTFIAVDGSWMGASTWGEGTDMGDKATNKAMTMAFKNVLAQSFAVSVEKNPDADAETPEETVVQHAQAQVPRPAPLEPKDVRLRRRIGELCATLDDMTSSEKGTWAGLVADATAAAWGNPYESAEESSLVEIGEYLTNQIKAKVTEAPDQIDLTA